MNRASLNRKHAVDLLFPVILFLVFSVAAISVILFAAKIYQSGVESAKMHYAARTSLEYLIQKVHRSDADGAVSVSSSEGHDMLILKDTGSSGTGSYRTCIYYADGALRELYTREGLMPDKGSGTAIVELSDFSVKMLSGHLLSLSCTDTEGHQESALVQIRSLYDDETP